MRSPGIIAPLLLCLSMMGCTSSSGLEDMVPGPSSETTGSIPRPSAPVADAAPLSTTRLAHRAAVMAPPASIAEDSADGDDDAGDGLEPTALVAPDKLVPKNLELPTPAPERGAMRKSAALSGAFRQGFVRERRFRDAKPINFGRHSPKKLAVHGVDVSRWQGDIDWEKLQSQGANFVYIKATDGGDHLDPMFMKNWRNAAQAGLPRGAYHFFYWCRVASEQADWFIRNVPKTADALPPVIDVEWNHESSCRRRPSRATVLEKMQVFMDRIEARYGQRPIIYTSPDFYRDNLQGAFLDYPFWLRAVAAHPSQVYPGRKWLFWQYSGSGLSHGVTGRIDLNVFSGDEAQWRAWLGGRQLLAQD